MRAIVVKYSGDCVKCGETLEVGTQAVYERRVGIFCPGCAPTDPEEIRAARQEGADRKADRLQGWADKRIKKAAAVFEHNRHYTSDIAFNTQPGHIPIRARIIAQEDKAHKSLEIARGMKARASTLRHVTVSGDAERKRQARREAVLRWLKVGMTVDTGIYGLGIVAKINKKTATIANTGQSRTYRVNVDLSWLTPVATAQDREE